jgi:class 3 adenylate cyclase
MSTCPACGFENAPAAKFCSECGARLAAEAAPAREERKVVTVLFCDLVGFTGRAEQLDPEDVRRLLSGYHDHVRRELERHGGTVEKFVGDAVMALFGAPIAHEDDPERAVRAALSIRDWAHDEQELQVRIGITTGEALVTLGARPETGEGMATGDVVNTASRLQAAAPENAILVDETTYRATERPIEYQGLESVKAKGKATSIVVWEPVQARSRFGVDVVQRIAAPLVGRADELDLLLGALARVKRERSAQLVTLIGVPGIGKSRLVYEVFRALERDPELVYWRQGRSLPYGAGVTFWALSEMVKAHAGVLETDSADAAGEKLRTAVAAAVTDTDDAPWIESHLRPLVGLAEDFELAGDRREEAFAAWRGFFEALAEERPLVLVFEDLQWADEGLLDFVDYLAEWARDVPLLTICTARPELLERRPGWSGGKVNAATVLVKPLSEEETARLLASLLERAVLPAELQSALLAKAGGNPLYAEEFARMSAERHAEDLPLPESVQGIIAARLDALPSAEKALLQDASVLGKVFWLAPLVAMGAGEPRTVERGLHSLARKEFVRAERRSSVADEAEYAFHHLLVRDVAYAQIPRALRAEKHRHAAEWIDSLGAGRAEDRAEMLAHHYLSALELAGAAGQETGALAERARLALREAGDRAAALNAFAAAARFYGQALELWPRADPERPYLLLRSGHARWQAEEAGAEEIEQARDELLELGDREAAAEADAMLSWFAVELRVQRAHVERARALLEQSPPSSSKAYVLTRLAHVAASGGDEAWPTLSREALEMAETLGLDDLRGQTLMTIGTARAFAGDPAGFAELEQSVEVLLSINSPESVRAHINLAGCLQAKGELARAFEVQAQGRDVAVRFGQSANIRHLRSERVLEHYWQGRWDDALEGAAAFLADVEAGSPNPLGEVACRYARARILLARGDLGRALAEGANGLETAREFNVWGTLEMMSGVHARTLLAAGKREEANALATQALAKWSSEPGPITYTGIDFAVCLAALGRGGELVRAAPSVPGYRWHEAAVAYCREDYAGSAAVLAESGSLPDEADARLRAAENAIRAGRRADGDLELQRALAFYRSVGATRYVREGESLLAETA